MVSDTSLLNNLQLGSRIECSEFYGTIRYIGNVEGHQSDWLGIDWDDRTRGKHDGSVNGVKYFSTSHPTSGSFVRPGKVQTGKDVITAITSRYGQKETASEHHINQLQLLSLQREINAPFLELVGFDKINQRQSNFQDLKIISLRLQLVSNPGSAGELCQICPNIEELDLSKNLFHKWSDIFIICEQLKNLHWLNVSENILEFPEDLQNISFPSLKTLICGRMRLNWSDILKLSTIFPAIEEFRIPNNLISQIELPNEKCFQYLKVFDIEGNIIESWDEITKLGKLKTLETINAANIGIKNITFYDQPGEKLQIFPKLKRLVISENFIDNWESVGELNKLQNLADLRFVKNPILETEKQTTCIQLIIARIAKLTILNGTIIKSDERKGAEYDYLKKYGLEYLAALTDENLMNTFVEKHSRYLELVNKHGAPEEAELIQKSHTLKSNLTSVFIQCESVIIPKKLPASMTLQKLIMLVQKLFKLPERPKLFYVNSSQPNLEIEMADEFKDIGYYSVQDGDTIFVRFS